jgi:hypothetical protein
VPPPRARRTAGDILAADRQRSVADGRAYVEAMLGFEVYSQGLYLAMNAHGEHESGHTHE